MRQALTWEAVVSAPSPATAFGQKAMLALALALPVPALAAGGLTLPLPEQVYRLAVAVIERTAAIADILQGLGQSEQPSREPVGPESRPIANAAAQNDVLAGTAGAEPAARLAGPAGRPGPAAAGGGSSAQGTVTSTGPATSGADRTVADGGQAAASASARSDSKPSGTGGSAIGRTVEKITGQSVGAPGTTSPTGSGGGPTDQAPPVTSSPVPSTSVTVTVDEPVKTPVPVPKPEVSGTVSTGGSGETAGVSAGAGGVSSGVSAGTGGVSAGVSTGTGGISAGVTPPRLP